MKGTQQSRDVMFAFTWSPDVVPLALSSSLYLFSSLPAFVFFILFYSQSARRSLNWSAFRRQSKSNQTLTSITNAPWVPVKLRIPTISVFRRTADNSGFTALLKISTAPTVADLRNDTSGLNVTSRFLLVLLVYEVWVSRVGSHAFYRLISINNSMTFSFHPAV